ncbi:MAG: glycerol-3-phosphate cytidylyltransferase [Candidatus Buchananbacteria bacterium RIFCSPHIGHO2_01_FULL_39_8]|uniref:Glycerol-3-phosphate cytidylyltransferase n=2 Tax=Candidatus Buchananiibacteriota TaxID=1817903 RepID=A0A1G1Y142_9BACT|nr:MAG: glycerol-3-phosphate cytidylyltransferase [Candidatus Buchananbacteria bacterium RIFCSPHIGHO2_01_FULL_39_8]
MKKIIIASGYFNPVHIGHIKLLKAAKKLGDFLVVVVNNDKQQMLKKGKIIMDENERMEIIKAIRYVDEVFLSIDEDKTQCKTLETLAEKYKDDKLIFANGGDRDSEKAIPETDICKKYNIEMRFGVGGIDKPNSSSNINKLLGIEE